MRTLLLASALLALLPAASAQDVSLSGTYDVLSLDEGFLPDPATVEVVAGGSNTPDVAGCAYGSVADAPDVEVDYSTSGGSTLYIYAESGSDTTLLVNAADGSWSCNDDTNGLNPVIVLRNATSGRYDIWVGTYGDSTAPATLYVSEIDPRN